MRPRHLLLSAVGGAIVLGWACVADLGATAQKSAEASPGDAAESIAALLAAARTESAIACALVVRGIDMQGWSRWDGVASDLLDVDSLATRHLRNVQRLPASGVDVVPLEAALRDPVWCVRRVGASLLSRQKQPAALEALRRAAADSRADVRAIGVLALGLADAEGEAQLLQQRLKDDDATVRRWAAWALGALQVDGTASALFDLLARDPDARVRQAAAWAVGEIEGA